MAFFSRAGNVLRQVIRGQANTQVCVSAPSAYQTIRCMSSSKLFVGGISYGTDEQSLKEAFDKYGQVIEARVIVDRETGRSRGFGFVTYTSSEEASCAIQALDGQDLHGRRIKVNYATDRARGFGRSGGFAGGYGGPGGDFGGFAGNSYGSNPSYVSSGGSFDNPGAGGYGGGDFASGNTYGSTGNTDYSNEGSFGGNNHFGGEFGSSNELGAAGQYGNMENSGMEDGTGRYAQGDLTSGDWRDGDTYGDDDAGLAKRA